MSQITVYTKPACDACKATFRTLNKAGISYQVVDITEDATARDYVMSLGLSAGPRRRHRRHPLLGLPA